MNKILFVCHGNICRSTMAEFVLKDMVNKMGLSDKFMIESAGTSCEESGSDIHYGTKKKLTEMKIPFESRKARRVNVDDYHKFDWLICMDDNNVKNLKSIIGNDTDNKIKLLLSYAQRQESIKDPWYTNDFDATYIDVVDGCHGIIKTMK